MKRVLFFVTFMSYSLCFYAQPFMDYNLQGNQALQKKDYQKARSWFSEGVERCDPYSIQKLAEIWREQPAMRSGMLLPMRKSFDCLKTLAETKDQNAMFLFSEFYRYGIGTEKDSVLADYWYKEYGISLRFPFENTSDTVLSTQVPIPKIPKKGLLSNRFYSFVTYTYSPTMPVGFSLGFYDKMGFYISYRTNLKSIETTFECNNTSVFGIGIENPAYWFENGKWGSQMATGGLLCPIIKKKLFFSVGGGYGKRDYYREIKTLQYFSTGLQSEWCHNVEASYEGWAVEAGAMFVWKKLVVAGGVNSTLFKDLDVYLSLGLSF